MNDKNEEIKENLVHLEKIKVFLKIKPPPVSDKIYFSISKDKKCITMLDNSIKEESKKSKHYDVDKIFDYNDENSYIYEEIMCNCIKESLAGVNFTFISYGDSNSEKSNLIIGDSDCYENITTRGLFPRLLDNYLSKIDSKESLSDTISLYLSYIMINNSNLIDLCTLMGRDNKILEKLTLSDLKKHSKEIKQNEFNLIKQAKKVICENAKDSLFFLLQLLKLFYKLETNNSHFFQWSYFIIILYVTDNNGKIISTITFIIMPGNEILQNKTKKPGSNSSKVIKNFQNKLESEFSFSAEEILKNLKIDNSEEEGNKYKNQNKSKLMTVLGNIAFDSSNKELGLKRGYRIIGSINGNSGFYQNTKETLSFLSQCKKIAEEINNSKKGSNNNEKYINLNYLEEKIRSKDEQIYDLKSKVETQEIKLNKLNEIMENKEANLLALKANYKQQIETLKDALGFKGDIQHLLDNDKNSNEYINSVLIRKTTEENNFKNNQIEELKEQIKKIEIDNKQLKSLIEIKKNDGTMIDIVRIVKKMKDTKIKEIGTRNRTGKLIDELIKNNHKLQKKLNMIKKELEDKKFILKGLPEIMKNKKNYNKEVKNSDELESKEEINKNQILKENEKEALINKYESILRQNRDEITQKNISLNNIDNNFKKEKDNYFKELIQIYKIIYNLINLYSKCFSGNSSIFLEKQHYDLYMSNEEKKINQLQFPLLYKILEKNGINYFNITFQRDKKPKSLNNKNDNNKKKNEHKQENIHFNYSLKKNNIINEIKKGFINELNNNQCNNSVFSLEEILNEKKKIFEKIDRKRELKLLSMSKEDLLLYSKTLLNKINNLEYFVNKYFDFKKNIIEFNLADEIIKDKLTKLKEINQIRGCLVAKNKKIFDKMEKGDNIIKNMQNENSLLKKKLFGKDFISSNNLFPLSSYMSPLVKSKFKKKKLNLDLFSDNYHKFLANTLNKNNTTFNPSNTLVSDTTSSNINSIKGKDISNIHERNYFSNNTFDYYTQTEYQKIHNRNIFIIKQNNSSRRTNPYFEVSDIDNLYINNF